jgi:ATP phosphoribosyltransferase regulatory subunit
VAIASGGRYDRLVQRFSPNDPGASGVGFGFAVEEVRQLLEVNAGLPPGGGGSEHLVAFARADQLNGALDRLQEHHRQGLRAELWPDPCASRAEAEQIAQRRGIASLDWLG